MQERKRTRKTTLSRGDLPYKQFNDMSNKELLNLESLAFCGDNDVLLARLRNKCTLALYNVTTEYNESTYESVQVLPRPVPTIFVDGVVVHVPLTAVNLDDPNQTTPCLTAPHEPTTVFSCMGVPEPVLTRSEAHAVTQAD